MDDKERTKAATEAHRIHTAKRKERLHDKLAAARISKSAKQSEDQQVPAPLEYSTDYFFIFPHPVTTKDEEDFDFERWVDECAMYAREEYIDNPRFFWLKIEGENAKMKEENAKMKEEIGRIKEENAKMKDENGRMKEEIVRIEAESERMKEEGPKSRNNSGGRPQSRNLTMSGERNRARKLAKAMQKQMQREQTPETKYRICRQARRNLRIYTPKKWNQQVDAPCRLTPYQDIWMCFRSGISTKARLKIKRNLLTFGFNFFASDRMFFETKKRISNRIDYKWEQNFLVCSSLESLRDRIETLDRKGQFHENKIRVAIMGDKGGDLTKIIALPILSRAGNSAYNSQILAMWHGDDNQENLQKLNEATNIFSDLNNFEGVEWFVSGDLKFLRSILGHSGATSYFPCAICRVPKGQLHEKGIQRSFDATESNFSFNFAPLVNVSPNNIIPPSLHMVQGLCKRAIEILEEMIGDKAALDELFKELHLQRNWRRTFCGNEMKKLLDAEENDKILSELAIPELKAAARSWSILFLAVRWWFHNARSSHGPMPENEQEAEEKFEQIGNDMDEGARRIISQFEVLRRRLEMAANNEEFSGEIRIMAQQAAKKCKLIPKGHYLLHTGQFMRAHHFWGMASEQSIEALHAIMNIIELKYKNTPMMEKRMEKIAKHHYVLNYLFDNGFFDCDNEL